MSATNGVVVKIVVGFCSGALLLVAGAIGGATWSNRVAVAEAKVTIAALDARVQDMHNQITNLRAETMTAHLVILSKMSDIDKALAVHLGIKATPSPGGLVFPDFVGGGNKLAEDHP